MKNGDTWREHDAEIKWLEREQEHIKRALHRQTLRLEEHDDPNHPVVAAAKQRIEELVDLLEAFDVTATYDKPDRLHLAATVPAELVSENENPDRPKGEHRGIRS